MGFMDLAENYSEKDKSALAELLIDFIVSEKSLQNSEQDVRNLHLRHIRILVTELRAPPYNLSVEILTEICDNLNAWQDQITIWKNP
jgi:hypothetical protein